MIVASGSGTGADAGNGTDEVGNAHGYWALAEPLTTQGLEDANRRLALELGADARCADPPRILRIPETLNFKDAPPREVLLRHCTSSRHQLDEILARLPVRPDAASTRSLGLSACPRQGDDPLLAIEPARYVRALLSRQPGRNSKIHCPFHDDETPSFHVYRTPERGWACFGCVTPSGKPLGGDIYTLASLLWKVPNHGHHFFELRDRLDPLFEIRRD
jgi:hypothetical protein